MSKTLSFIRWSIVVVSCAAVAGCAVSPKDSSELTLTVLHTNDTHSFAAGISSRAAPCLDDTHCFGGYARLAQAVVDERRSTDNILVLDAGDAWQGSYFFKVFGTEMLLDFVRDIGWDVVTLGNHEFDLGCQKTVDYVKNLPVPVVAANIADNPECKLSAAGVLVPWVIRSFKGIQVAVVGMANDEAKEVSKACRDTEFMPRREALQEVVDQLREQGVQHVIALTHLGYSADCELAANVTGVDLFVGGHTHDVLGNYPGSAGEYPTRVTTPDGNTALIVTAKRGTEFLGKVTVHFDKDGNIVDWQGDQKHLTPSEKRSAKVRDRVELMARRIDSLRGMTIAKNNLDVRDGLDACRAGECLSALLTVDAMLEYGKKFGADIALINAGSIRDALPVGDVKEKDVTTIHPFNDEVRMRELTGTALLNAVEHGVSDPKVEGPYLLQPANLRYCIDRMAPAGKRTKHVEIYSHGQWMPVERDARYRVIVNEYLDRGGDGFSMIRDAHRIEIEQVKTVKLFEDALRRNEKVRLPKGGRIVWEK